MSDDKLCESCIVYRGKVARRCFYPEGHEGRHHNGSDWWDDTSKNADRRPRA